MATRLKAWSRELYEAKGQKPPAGAWAKADGTDKAVIERDKPDPKGKAK